MTPQSNPQKTNVPPSCAACPAFHNRLCDSLTHIATAGEPAANEPHDHNALARRSVWRQGETLDRVPVLCQGWAATAITMSDGRRQILSFLLPGEMVSAVLINEPVSLCSVEAITDVRFRLFPREAIKAAMLRQPDLFAAVAKMWTDEAARADRLAIDLGRRGATERIASLVLNLADRLHSRGMMQDQTMDFPLRQHHIADAVGLTVVHVGNVLAEFRRAGLIDINERSLTILDAVGLRRLADAA